MELTHLKGFYNVTMDELAVRAGISKRTIYRYFKSKDEIIEAVIDTFLENMGREIDKILAAGKNPEEIFSDIVANFYQKGRVILNPLVLQDLRKHYPQYWRKIDKFRIKKIEKVIETFLIYSNKEDACNFNPQIVTGVVLASIHAVLNPEFIISNGLTFNEVLEQLLGIFKHGILNSNKK